MFLSLTCKFIDIPSYAYPTKLITNDAAIPFLFFLCLLKLGRIMAISLVKLLCTALL